MKRRREWFVARRSWHATLAAAPPKVFGLLHLTSDAQLAAPLLHAFVLHAARFFTLTLHFSEILLFEAAGDSYLLIDSFTVTVVLYRRVASPL